MLWCDHGVSPQERMISRVEALLEIHLLLTAQMKAVPKRTGPDELVVGWALPLPGNSFQKPPPHRSCADRCLDFPIVSISA